jgi:hemerythrin-like domain-containing protein
MDDLRFSDFRLHNSDFPRALPVTNRVPSSTDPVRQLIDEHEIFMDALHELATVMASVNDGAQRMPIGAMSTIEQAWHAVNEHLNVHFVKEEDIFFPFIERLVPGARVKFQFLHIDHERLRESFELFTEALQDCRAHGTSATCIRTLRTATAEMIRWFEYHIVAEDSIYFEIAEKELSRSECDEVLARMHAVEQRLREYVAPREKVNDEI